MSKEVMELTELQAAREQLDAATQDLNRVARNTLEQLVTDGFEDDEIKNIAWAQKSSEYNDEGMYPGIVGPVVNVTMKEDDYESREWMYDYRTEADKRLPELAEALKLIGEDILSEIFGDEAYVVATKVPGGGVLLESEYARY